MTELDFAEILREIDDEVRARRASGDIPPDLERELDREFARYVPAAASDDDFEGILAAAERSAFIDPDPPTASRIPLVGALKAGERKLLAWYFRFVTQQVTALAAALVQSIDVLGRRVEALSKAVQPGGRGRITDGVAAVASAPSALVDVVADRLAGATGRVLVVEAGDGTLVRRLADAELDVYGIEPSPDRATALSVLGLDVRDDEPALHLGSIAERSLAGLVLVGCVDRQSLEALLHLADLAAETLSAGASVVVIGRHPDGWGAANPVEADLSPGRPLRPETWAHLLGERGLVDVTTTQHDGAYAVCASRA